MQEIPEQAYPLFAPLPLPLVHQVLSRRGSPWSSWRELEGRVRQARETVYTLMHPVVDGHRLTTSWLLQALLANAPGNVAVGTQTLTLWKQRGLLRHQRHGRPAPDTAAALLIARMIDPRRRRWLPPMIPEGEPVWWCWRQDEPRAPLLPCPIPLPAALPAGALLWTPWRGACWQGQRWLRFGSLGALRWAGTQALANGERWGWALTQNELEAWDRGAAALARGFPLPDQSRDDIQREILHLFAHLALYRLATGRLGMFAEPDPDFSSLGLPPTPRPSHLPAAGLEPGGGGRDSSSGA